MLHTINRKLNANEIRKLLADREVHNVISLCADMRTRSGASHIESLGWIIKEAGHYSALGLELQGGVVGFDDAVDMTLELEPNLYVYSGPETIFEA
jgi:hypothetical protein